MGQRPRPEQQKMGEQFFDFSLIVKGFLATASNFVRLFVRQFVTRFVGAPADFVFRIGF